jgi:[ribosomal protein S5]-alanine N-acetyltransferase
MVEFPILATKRLILRPFSIDDALIVKLLAGDREIAATTLTIPHPYDDGIAEAWIATHRENFESNLCITWAVTSRRTGHLLGAISLMMRAHHNAAEVGYWIGKKYWGKGYCTEAAGKILEYGFLVQKLNRIYATCFEKNPASGRVLEKIGMSGEGCLRHHVKKWGVYENLLFFGILNQEYLQRRERIKKSQPQRTGRISLKESPAEKALSHGV